MKAVNINLQTLGLEEFKEIGGSCVLRCKRCAAGGFYTVCHAVKYCKTLDKLRETVH